MRRALLVLSLLAWGCTGQLAGGEGVRDAGALRDAGHADDAGDGGAATTADGGSRIDAGSTSDGGTGSGPPDAGPPDAGGPTGSDGGGGTYPGPVTRTATHGGASFEYALYLPDSYDPAVPVALLCLFHGTGNQGPDFRDYLTPIARESGIALLATTSTGSSGGWVPSADVPRFDAALQDALGAYNIDAGRLYVYGFSAGAQLAHGVALQNASTFAAYGVTAGGIAGVAGTDGPGRASRHIPVALYVGRDDPWFPIMEMDREVFLAAGWTLDDDLRYVAFEGGHSIDQDQLREIVGFLLPWRLP